MKRKNYSKTRFLTESAFSILLMAILISCASSREEWVHPDPDRLPQDSEVNNFLDFAVNYTDPIPDFFDPQTIDTSFLINPDPKPRDEFYVYPEKVVADREGFIYVLHPVTHTIHVYSPEGEMVYKIGKGGRGPGEFLKLRMMALDESEGLLYALDMLKIEVFKKEGNRYEYKSTIPLKFNGADDMCLLNGYIYVSGENLGYNLDNNENGFTHHPISKINAITLETEEAFGFEYKSITGRPRFNTVLSRTLLDCNSQTNTVIGYSENFSYLFGYDENGNRKWLSKIEPYLSREFIEFRNPKNQNPGLIHGTNTTLYHRKFKIRSLPHQKYSLLQVEHIKPWPRPENSMEPELPEFNYRSVLVDTETGELQGSDVYKLILYKDSTRAITYEPVPGSKNEYEYGLMINKF